MSPYSQQGGPELAPCVPDVHTYIHTTNLPGSNLKLCHRKTKQDEILKPSQVMIVNAIRYDISMRGLRSCTFVWGSVTRPQPLPLPGG
jgi:hypothetical protein